MCGMWLVLYRGAGITVRPEDPGRVPVRRARGRSGVRLWRIREPSPFARQRQQQQHFLQSILSRPILHASPPVTRLVGTRKQHGRDEEEEEEEKVHNTITSIVVLQLEAKEVEVGEDVCRAVYVGGGGWAGRTLL